MGCAASTMESEEDFNPLLQDKKMNDLIEQQIQLRRQNEKQLFKLLLLGAGESGKSTVLKQLRLLHQGGFSQPERVQYAQVIWVDLIQSMKILIIQARKFGVPLDCDKANNPLTPYKQLVLRIDPLQQIETDSAGGSNFLSEFVIKYSEGYKQKRKVNTGSASTAQGWDMNLADDDSNKLTIEGIATELQEVSKFQNGGIQDRFKVAEAIKKLWEEDSGIRRTFARANEFQMETNVKYYFENVNNFADPNYICTDTDILKGRIKTTGITESNFDINSFKFRVLDAGGQRSERKKWIHCFEGINAILFVVALSEYDQTLFEDERVNRMHESIILFDSLCNSKWFANTPFILFLNKIDLFQEKLPKSPLRRYFPDYQGSPNNVEEAVQFFTNIFLRSNRTNKPIYVHTTCATDTKSMKFVLAAVTDVIVQKSLQKSGLI
ncbi:guanine nucleotide-binding protein alpha-1 subunit [[Candida] anglica]|uniref:Guanine nucleotide-binding protein alpha-1 subunit n=1 Tax=[Candida] anglica TaxID=148631 RepID=A0ABP0EDB1_9ASCO